MALRPLVGELPLWVFCPQKGGSGVPRERRRLSFGRVRFRSRLFGLGIASPILDGKVVSALMKINYVSVFWPALFNGKMIFKGTLT